MVQAGAGTRICLGSIGAPHGVRGALRVNSFAGHPEDIAAYGPLSDEAGTRRFTLRIVGRAKDQLVCRIEGVDDRDAAAALRGTRLYVERELLPPAEDEEEFYHADLVGLRAELGDGTAFGTVLAVVNHGAGDLLDVVREAGDSVTVPFTRAAVPVVDLAGGRVVIDPPPGLLEEVPEGEEEDSRDR
ncbi:MAG: ribosome maturation factor RimM [Acetobacterales bacterium]